MYSRYVQERCQGCPTNYRIVGVDVCARPGTCVHLDVCVCLCPRRRCGKRYLGSEGRCHGTRSRPVSDLVPLVSRTPILDRDSEGSILGFSCRSWGTRSQRTDT